MVLIGVENKITKVGVVDLVDINNGTNTMDNNNVNTIVTIGLVNTFDSIKGESCKCWWEVKNGGDVKAGMMNLAIVTLNQHL